MASIFGGPFGHVGQLGQGVVLSPSGSGGGIPAGGFPGIFPGAGVSNSGWAGFNQLRKGPCTPDDVKKGRCTLGPVPSLLGSKPRGWK